MFDTNIKIIKKLKARSVLFNEAWVLFFIYIFDDNYIQFIVLLVWKNISIYSESHFSIP